MPGNILPFLVHQIAIENLHVFVVLVPVVVVCGPLGALLSSHCHRQVLAATVYILEALALMGFLMTMPPLRLIAIGAAIIIFRWIKSKIMIMNKIVGSASSFSLAFAVSGIGLTLATVPAAFGLT